MRLRGSTCIALCCVVLLCSCEEQSTHPARRVQTAHDDSRIRVNIVFNEGAHLLVKDESLDIDSLLEDPGFIKRIADRFVEPITTAEEIKDAWGHPLVFILESRSDTRYFEVASPGENGVLGDEDDVSFGLEL